MSFDKDASEGNATRYFSIRGYHIAGEHYDQTATKASRKFFDVVPRDYPSEASRTAERTAVARDLRDRIRNVLDTMRERMPEDADANQVAALKRYCEWFCDWNWQSEHFIDALFNLISSKKMPTSDELEGSRKFLISQMGLWWRQNAILTNSDYTSRHKIFIFFVLLSEKAAAGEKRHILNVVRESTDRDCPVPFIEKAILYLKEMRDKAKTSGFATISSKDSFGYYDSNDIELSVSHVENESWGDVVRLLLAARKRNTESRDELAVVADEIAGSKK